MTHPHETPPLTADELRLLTVESRARALFLYHPTPLFELDPEGRFRHANLAAARFADLNEQEGKGVHFSRFIAPAHRERVERNFQRALGGKPSRCAAEVINLTGHHHRVEMDMLPIACERGMLGVYVLLHPRQEPVPRPPGDASAPHDMAATRLLEAIPLGTALLDLTRQDYPVLGCNQALCRLLDMPRDVIEGHQLPVLRERESLAVRQLHTALARRQPIRERLTLTRRGGQPLPIQLYLQPLEAADGDSEAVRQMLALHVPLHDTDSGSRAMERGLVL
ncbi:PAS domain-containing protein [Halomonas sp. PBN3]|uniref:PAS domain-containing protein n=1 Tax=Halomonas sp. PBN3 TaxID=1397528 RepID=UPI0003B84C90|nr:PAS domain-containing protein [Halomonas sp. PBN3]ERS82334.1 hypothetical protein Q671_12000 [Halomonas sp. PBN3]